MTTTVVIFDCDGVLFESEEANIAFYGQVLANAGVPAVDWGREQATHELASAKLFERYFGDRKGGRYHHRLRSLLLSDAATVRNA